MRTVQRPKPIPDSSHKVDYDDCHRLIADFTNNACKGVNELNIRGKLIGSGRKRKVYDLGNGYVLKVAKSRAGLHSNKTEFMLYRSKRINSLRKHLAKVTRYGRRWLIMKKYDRPFILSSKHYKQYRLLKRRFRRKGIRPRDIYSMTHKAPSLTNLRLNRRGEIVVIDYGNFRVRSKHWRRGDA